MSENLTSFKDVVAHFDITPRTLRYYEYLELISPIRDGAKRFYTKREMTRIELILRGRRFGFKLEEIRQWLEMYNPNSDNRAQNQIWVDMAGRQLEELRQRQKDLELVISELEERRRVVQEKL